MEVSPTNDVVNLSEVQCSSEELVPISIKHPSSNESSEILDFTDTFTTDEVFNSRDELFKWVREVGKTVGTVVVVARSDYSQTGKTPKINFGCERGGKYRGKGSKKVVEIEKPTRRSGTKRCGCPFSLIGMKLPGGDQWKLTVVCGTHNHPIADNFEGHSYAGRLTPNEKQILHEMSIAGVKPKDVLRAIKERDGQNASTLTTIYNARAHMKFIEKDGKSQMQILLQMLAERGYVEWHRSIQGSDKVRDLFWAHPESIQLAQCFPSIFLMDCTYKNNRYEYPLLEIVGVTSTVKTFSFAFVYMEVENEDNYIWALERMKLILYPKSLPSIIVTDKEPALMNAIKRVFPKTQNFLCRQRISKNIVTKCKPMFEAKEVWDKFIMSWNALVISSTEGEYEDLLASLENDFSEKYPRALSYVKNNWLTPYKECFVAAWTDQYMHFGNTIINRVDSAHAKLKKQLRTSQDSFSTSFPTIHTLLELQRTDIKASFEKSLQTVMPDFSGMMFNNLRGLISKHALDIILDENERGDSLGSEANICGCVIRRTHGLPCACEIAQYKLKGSTIPLSHIDSHWKKLSSVPTEISLTDHDCFPDVVNFMNRFDEVGDDVKINLLKRLREMSDPQSTHLDQPEAKKNKREKHRSVSNSMEYDSEEDSDRSGSEISSYKEKPSEERKAGKHKVKYPNASLRCHCCMGKKKQDYRYKDHFQCASGVGQGSSNRSPKQRANQLALTKYSETELDDAPGPTQSMFEPEPVETEDLDKWQAEYNEISGSLERMIEENDKLHHAYNEELRKMQRSAHEHIRRIIYENEKLKSDLESQRIELERRSKELDEREAQNELERRKLNEEMNKVLQSEVRLG